MRNVLKLVVALALVALLAGCGNFFISGSALTTIAISPSNTAVRPNKTQQFTANGTFGDGTTRDISSSVTWSSSAPSVATITSSGLATTLAVGSTTITATSATGGSGGSKVTGTTTLTVSNRVVTALTIAPASSSMRIGQTQQYTATATLSDNTTSDVTNSVTWASSNT